MPLVISTNDSVVDNTTAQTGAPAVQITGDRVRLINGAGGSITSTSRAIPALQIIGQGVTVINALGGVISAISNSEFAIQGSANADRIENSGTISGFVNLGGGNDFFLASAASGAGIALGAGDDIYQFVNYAAQSFVNGGFGTVIGGSGNDRVILSQGSIEASIVNFGSVSEFEELEVRAGINNIQFASGFERIFLEPGTFTNFVFSANPLVDIILQGNQLGIGVGSTIHSVTGGNQNDSILLGGGGSILGSVDLGGGDDGFVLFNTQGVFASPVIGGTVQGGTGNDTLQIGYTQGESVDLSNFSGFEALLLANGSGIPINEVILNANGYLSIAASGINSFVRLVNSNSPLATVRIGFQSSSATLQLDGATTIASFGFGTGPANSTLVDPALSLTLQNAGTILGDIWFDRGNDTYDGRLGTVGGAIFGYAGNDTLIAGVGNNFVDGGVGNDFIEGGPGSDTLIGGAGIDTLGYGNAVGGVYVELAAGFTLETALQAGTVSGGTAVLSTDRVTEFENAIGSAFGDRIYGTSGTNSLVGLGGDDIIYAEGGDDFVVGGAGSDVLLGGTGIDTVDYSTAVGAVFLDLSGYALETSLLVGTVGASSTIISIDGLGGFENALGSSFGDRIYGTDVANTLSGQAGDDIIYAEGGDDVVVGGAGSDILLGGAGIDTLDYSAAVGAVYADLAGYSYETGQTTGTVFALTSLLSTDLHVQFETLIGSAFGDRLYGSAGANLISGGNGDDILYGLDGADTLSGGQGDDRIIGGAGADVLSGGAGADRFIFSTAPEAASDVISDFETGVDKLFFLRAAFGIGVAAPFTLVVNGPAVAANSFLYDSATGTLQFDADGAGGAAALLVANIGGGTALALGDLVLYG